VRPCLPDYSDIFRRGAKRPVHLYQSRLLGNRNGGTLQAMPGLAETVAVVPDERLHFS
jgi:hypothetical protein